MKGRLAAVLGAALLLFATLPAHAGTLYLALAKSQQVAGVQYETEIKVTNTASEPKNFVTFFIPTNAVGVERPDDMELPVQTLPAGATRIYRGLSSDIPTGMLEITGDPELVFSARLIPKVNGQEKLGAQIPFITDADVVPGGSTMHIQGVRRDANHFTSYGLINMAQENGECRVVLKAADGTALIDPVILGMAPLQQFHFTNILDIIGVSGNEIRVETECTRGAFSYAHVFNSATGEVARLDMSASGASRLVAPGAEEPCPPGGVCFEEKGTFHAPRPGNEVWLKWYRLPPGQRYSQLKVRLEVFHGGWDRDAGGLHNFFWIARNEWKSNTFGYVNARGGNKNFFQNTTNVDLTKKGETQRTPVNVALQPGTTYIVDYTYDAAAGRITTILTTRSGAEVARIVEPATIRSNRIVTEGEGFFIECGLKRIFQEVPTYGWTYSNLRFELIP